MNNITIRVENLSKRYRLGVREQRYGTLGDALISAAKFPLRNLQRLRSLTHFNDAETEGDVLWALRDVSFEVEEGQVVGIIGANGAGKSTLLKILSKITKPSSGRATIHGRVASLLEVGTGFHGELTGRENVYLNAAILGMRKKEIEQKFDEIVEFSGVAKFIDTPIKFFSSGMQVRLAFAVAAHLEPEILIIDEVLAVGDAAFQKKCLGKIDEVSGEGRTVLFVSHNMAAIARLCERTILFDQGRILLDGPTSEVTSVYFKAGSGTSALREWTDAGKAPGNDIARLRSVRVRTENEQVTEVADIRQAVGLDMEFDVLDAGHVLVPNFHVFNEEGACAFVVHDNDPRWHRRPRPTGRYISTAWIPGNLLAEGMLFVGAALSTMDPLRGHFYERDAVSFQVVDSLDGDSARGDYAGPMPGVVRPLLQWSTQYESSELEASAVLESSEK